MAFYVRKTEPLLEAFQWQPGLVLDGVEERTVTHEHMSPVPRQLGYFVNRHGKGYYVPPGDYLYRDADGHWDACPRDFFERQYERVADPAAPPSTLEAPR